VSLGRVRGRVARLEHDAGLRGPCRVCDGRGSYTVAMNIGEREIRPPKGCAGCGRIAAIKRIILPEGMKEPVW
jgi:hypothetical protein